MQGSSSKKELQLFNRINIPIQNLLSRARGGTALIQSLFCDRVTFGQNSLRNITIDISGQVHLKLIYFKHFKLIYFKRAL